MNTSTLSTFADCFEKSAQGYDPYYAYRAPSQPKSRTWTGAGAGIGLLGGLGLAGKLHDVGARYADREAVTNLGKAKKGLSGVIRNQFRKGYAAPIGLILGTAGLGGYLGSHLDR